MSSRAIGAQRILIWSQLHRFVGGLAHHIRFLWFGPADLPRALRVEWRFVAVRWIGIVSMTIGLPLTDLPMERLQGVYGVLAFAAIYSLLVQLMMQRYPRLFASGYLTVTLDCMLNVAMMVVAGGFDTPFYYILFTVTISAAMRYGYGPSLLMALFFVAFDVVEDVGGSVSLSGPFFFRSGFLCITAILAGFLKEQTERAESALEERLRQANLLNEATAVLGASLEFETVLREVVTAASRLFGSDHAALLCSTHLEDEDHDLPSTVHYPADEPSAIHRELASVCSRCSRKTGPVGGKESPVLVAALPSGHRVVVLDLAVATRHISRATLALADPRDVPHIRLAPDIFDSFVARAVLALENAALHRSLTRRSSALQRAYAELADAHQELLGLDEMKTSFLANVSHELRTPMNSIRAFSELLLSYDDDVAVQREFLQIINSESERLTRLINDLLDIAKIESGRMDWQMSTVNLVSLLWDSAHIYRSLAERQGLVFETEIPADLPAAFGDADRLQQVMGNLLSNALKFTPRGSIKLGAVALKDQVKVYVADTGIGIRPDDLDRVFDKFMQVGDMLTDKPRGTGLGLAICREIVLHHGGRIWAESEPGSGSVFAFTVPALVPAPRLDPEASHPAELVLAGASSGGSGTAPERG